MVEVTHGLACLIGSKHSFTAFHTTAWKKKSQNNYFSSALIITCSNRHSGKCGTFVGYGLDPTSSPQQTSLTQLVSVLCTLMVCHWLCAFNSRFTDAASVTIFLFPQLQCITTIFKAFTIHQHSLMLRLLCSDQSKRTRFIQWHWTWNWLLNKQIWWGGKGWEAQKPGSTLCHYEWKYNPLYLFELAHTLRILPHD